MKKGIAIFICLISYSLSFGQCEHPDYDALMQFYESTNGEDWTYTTGWKAGADGISCDPCDFEGDPWYGLRCENGRVTHLTTLHPYIDDVQFNNLTGVLPDLQMDELIYIDLSTNSITGPVPDFSGLPKLETFYIWSNELTGQIPDFSMIPNLEYLNVSVNNFEGPMPSFKNTPNLKFLSISSAGLTGPIYDVSNTLKLEVIFADGNELSGELPDFSKLNSLIGIQLSSNLLEGPIDQLSQNELTGLFLNNNNFSGCFPDNACTNLTNFNFSGNPQLPFFGDHAEACQSGSLKFQDAAFCAMSKAEDAWIGVFSESDCACLLEECTSDLTEFNQLMQFYEAMDGENWLNKRGWDQAAAGYHCDPCSYADQTWYGIGCENGKVTCIDMDGSEDCTFLGLGGNNLSGVIPEFDLVHMKDLFLDDNNISGSIPSLEGLPILNKLHLSFNELTGELPQQLTDCIEEFRCSNNQLTGPIPDYSAYSDLIVFTAAFNDLTGCIPEYVCTVPLIDLSANPQLSWSGDHSQVCMGIDQVGAPCVLSSGAAGFIDEDCNCTLSSHISEAALNHVQIFPNPVEDKLSYTSGNTFSVHKVYSTNGRLLFSGKCTENIIDVNALQSGIYILKLFDTEKRPSIHPFIKL